LLYNYVGDFVFQFNIHVKSKRSVWDKAKLILELLLEHSDDPGWYIDKAQKLISYLYFKYIGNELKNKRQSIFSKEWDHLLILDACSHDLFQKVLGKKVPYLISMGSCTPEFLLNNFTKDHYDDIIYINANPLVELYIPRDKFFKFVPVWKFAWNSELKTVLPEDVSRFSKLYHKKYPDKRLIAHFMQPHIPFLDYPELGGGLSAYYTLQGKRNKQIKNPWELAKRGEIPVDLLLKAYESNLRRVLPVALDLGSFLRGKTIITADHGNAFKKLSFPPYFVRGHPCGVYIDELLKVPWFEVPK